MILSLRICCLRSQFRRTVRSFLAARLRAALMVSAWLWLAASSLVSAARAQPPTDFDLSGAGVQLGAEIEVAGDPVKSQQRSAVLSVTVDGRELAVQAVAGTLELRDEHGERIADVFHVYYRVAREDNRPRPLTFCFNGGPGSSSVWLHLGMLGPRRVNIPDSAQPVSPPYQLESNPYSLLDHTDLVFIDPVGTGYSRKADGVERDRFHGYDQDIQTVGQFIHQFTTREGRWGAPLFLLGESYGCVRAAGLARELQRKYGMELNGVILISSVINFQTIRFDVGNDLPYALFLPSYAATAWYHKRLPSELQASLPRTVRQARRFALGRYTRALMQGDRLAAAERRAVATRVAELTGVSVQFVLDSNLRIPMNQFARQLLRDQNRTIGRLDSRFVGTARQQTDSASEYDPSHSAISGPFTSGLYQYFRQELGIQRSEPYEIMTGDVHPWSYHRFENKYVDSSEPLRQAMVRNPHLRVFVASGYFDLATPFAASEYSFSHLGLASDQRRRVKQAYYPSGHMIYVDDSSLKQLRRDLIAFYDECVPAAP